MVQLDLNLDGERAWPDLAAKLDAGQIIDYQQPVKVAVLPRGMSSGAPSVTLRFDLADGRVLLAQTSAKLFVLAARAIVARYPGQLGD